jgi:hypothetical protein
MNTMKDIKSKGPRAKGTRKTEDGRQNLQPATPSVALCGTSAASVVNHKETQRRHREPQSKIETKMN